MRKCYMCEEILSLDRFSWKNKKKGTKQTHCRECQKVYRRQHYLDNRKKYISKAAKNRRKSAKWMQSLKSGPCKDCNKKYPYYVMSFDHVRGKKKFGLSVGGPRYSRESVIEEIKKCEVVCSNCHAIRTHKRRSGISVTIG